MTVRTLSSLEEELLELAGTRMLTAEELLIESPKPKLKPGKSLVRLSVGFVLSLISLSGDSINSPTATGTEEISDTVWSEALGSLAGINRSSTFDEQWIEVLWCIIVVVEDLVLCR